MVSSRSWGYSDWEIIEGSEFSRIEPHTLVNGACACGYSIPKIEFTTLQDGDTTEINTRAAVSWSCEAYDEFIVNVKLLSGETEDQILANVNGVIESINATAGNTVAADTVICTIEVPDMGHSISFSVTNDQARRLRTGDTATVSNFYWGNEIVATLTNIRTDPKNPQNNKLLTFELEGDVQSGSELTLSVGSKSANYDLVVPNSAIKSDSNGSFVLVVEAKNSPLGSRYIAKRVGVEVLASDDNNSAVVAEISQGDFVITTSSAPIKSGDQVRLAEG